MQTVDIVINGGVTEPAFFPEVLEESRCLVLEWERLALAGSGNAAFQRQQQHLADRIPRLISDLAPGLRHPAVCFMGGQPI
jgi:hypothetical protein